MASPSALCGVGERDRFRRIGEQAGVLRLELLAVLQGYKEWGTEGGGGETVRELLQAWTVPEGRLREPGLGAGENQGEEGPATLTAP